jgi:hypothetical protein
MKFAVALLLLLPLAVRAQTATLSATPTTYSPAGGDVVLTATVSYPASASAVGFTIETPVGWRYVRVGGANPPGITPAPDQANGLLEFAFTSVPAGQLAFTVVIAGNPGLTGNQVITGAASYRGPLVIVPLPPITLTPAATAPSIVTPPASVSVVAGQSATFSVVAGGTTPLAYQWQKGGVNLAGATGTTLTLPAVNTAAAGSYAVVVSNIAGSIVAPTATLTVTSAVVAPAIVTPPAPQAVAAGASVTFSVTASGSVPLTYQWTRDGRALAGATGPSLTLSAVQPSDAGTYAVTVANSAGSAAAVGARLTVAPVPVLGPAGVYFGRIGTDTGTFALLVREDRSAVFVGRAGALVLVKRDAVVDASGRFDFSAAPSGNGDFGVSGTVAAAAGVAGRIGGLEAAIAAPALGAAAPTAALAGFYEARVAASSAVGYLVVGAAGEAYLVTVGGGRVDAGRGTVDAGGAIALTTELGARAAGLVTAAGGLTLTVTPAAGAPALSYSGANDAVRTGFEPIVNISTRSAIAAGRSLIAGFVITGDRPKPILVRAIGPTLTEFGVGGALPAARLQIFQGASVVAASDNWGAAPNAAAIAATAARVGAFPLAAASRDAALALALDPGAYTAVISGQGGVGGVGLVEVYDATDGAIPRAQRLVNISTRADAGAGDSTLIAGFVIAGTVPKRVLVRGVGPALAAFGVTNGLTQPRVAVYADATVLAENAGWSVSPDAGAIAAAAAEAGGFALPAGSADAALIVNLAPGAYTAQVSSRTGDPGNALLEVYELP